MYDYSLDMWSLGCMLASMIFRKEPFFHGHAPSLSRPRSGCRDLTVARPSHDRDPDRAADSHKSTGSCTARRAIKFANFLKNRPCQNFVTLNPIRKIMKKRQSPGISNVKSHKINREKSTESRNS